LYSIHLRSADTPMFHSRFHYVRRRWQSSHVANRNDRAFCHRSHFSGVNARWGIPGSSLKLRCAFWAAALAQARQIVAAFDAQPVLTAIAATACGRANECDNRIYCKQNWDAPKWNWHNGNWIGVNSAWVARTALTSDSHGQAPVRESGQPPIVRRVCVQSLFRHFENADLSALNGCRRNGSRTTSRPQALDPIWSNVNFSYVCDTSQYRRHG